MRDGRTYTSTCARTLACTRSHDRRIRLTFRKGRGYIRRWCTYKIEETIRKKKKKGVTVGRSRDFLADSQIPNNQETLRLNCIHSIQGTYVPISDLFVLSLRAFRPALCLSPRPPSRPLLLRFARTQNPFSSSASIVSTIHPSRARRFFRLSL